MKRTRRFSRDCRPGRPVRGAELTRTEKKPAAENASHKSLLSKRSILVKRLKAPWKGTLIAKVP